MKTVRGYHTSRPIFGERVPQAIQNIVIKEYCGKNNLKYLLSKGEYSFNNSYFILINILNELNGIDGIVCYSLFQLPSNNIIRTKIINQIIEKDKEIHFSLENLSLKNRQDLYQIETLFKIKLHLWDCPKENLLLE